jgi:hypothetical protein
MGGYLLRRESMAVANEAAVLLWVSPEWANIEEIVIVPAKQVDQSVGDGGDRGDLKRTHHGAATLIEHEPEVPYLVWQAPEIIVHATIARDETAPSQIDLDVLLAAAESLRNQRASAVEYLGLARA